MSTAASPSAFDKNNPFPATQTENRRISAVASQKETRHFVINIENSGLTYKCGDSLGVFPTNDADTVDALIKALGLDGHEVVQLPKSEEKLALREALKHRFAINGPTLGFVKKLAEKATGHEKEHLDSIINNPDKEWQKQWLADREFIDLAEEFPGVKFTATEYLESLRKLMPRLYSIASAPAMHPQEIHLTVAVVRYETNGRKRNGVCSSYLADRVEHHVPVFVAHSHFAPPADDNTPVIMVGPGTGVAPFRSFVQDREGRGVKNGKSWLFFGDQRKDTDFLYHDEWDKYLESKALGKLSTAFSRDQVQKVYVQDRMRENGAELWKWIAEGAAFYVCGDAKRMAKDVDAALHEIVATHGGKTPEEATEFVKQLKKDGRYQRDVY
jgi:sulfite reductase (NADPH) flavoprotein alpha-component